MFKKLRKHKKGQATLEFCLAVPVVLLLTLGVVDIAKANIIKLETTQAMQAYISLASADSKDEHTGTLIKQYTADYIQQTAMFCTKVQGARSQVHCKAGVEPVHTQLRLETKNQKLQAGTQICMAAKSEYKPFYSGVYSGGKMTIYSRACTLMETNKNNSSGWQSIARGNW